MHQWLLLGTADSLTDPDGSRTFLERSRTKGKTAPHNLRLVREGLHELHTNPQTREELKELVSNFVMETAQSWDPVTGGRMHQLEVKKASQPRYTAGVPGMVARGLEWLVWLVLTTIISCLLLLVPSGTTFHQWLQRRASQM